MATLYEATGRARRIIMAILVVILVIFGWETYTKYRDSDIFTGPTTVRFYMDANLALGTIPELSISGIVLNQDFDPEFILNGKHSLSVFPDVAYVYAIEQPREKLLTFENAKKTAQVLGYESEGYQKATETQVRWIKENDSQVLTYDKSKLIWKMETDYTTNTAALAKKNLSTDINVYAAAVKSFLTKGGFNSLGLANGQANIKYMSLGIDSVFVSTDNARQAEYVSITVQRKLPLADLKPKESQPETTDKTIIPDPFSGLVYKSDPREGSVNVVVSNRFSEYTKDVFELSFTDFEYGKTGSYFIINPDEAWTNVQRGKGFLVSMIPEGFNYFAPYPKNIKVTEFSASATQTQLGYWEPENWNGFAYPIYIFKGVATLEDGRLANFVFYADALKRL